MDTIRILLVDDHQVVREGLRHMLELEADMEVVGKSGMSHSGGQAPAYSGNEVDGEGYTCSCRVAQDDNHQHAIGNAAN
ncbi:unnamed protein product [marine sediment metagenome]|uniref:Response regulatory domain-containing protein n=1 Tax=marine sediment metagenome TaxID=412755 RepID=X1LI40_9ZZZZ